MSTLGEIVTVVKDTTRQGSPEVIRTIIQRCYYRICALTDWSLLQRKKLLVFGTGDSSGKIMPSDMIGITDVVPTGGSEED